jgi:branched-chain amino acid aminotransferase
MATPMIPFDDRDGYIWMDGKMIPWREAMIHVMTHSLHYSGAVFEGARSYSGNIFKLREHSQRLLDSGQLIHLNIPFSLETLEEASREVMEANGLKDGYLRPLAWRGAEQMGVSVKDFPAKVMIACWAWPKYYAADAGISMRTSSWRKPDPRTMPVQSKTAAMYTVGTIAKNEAEKHGFNDALMLDCQGRVAEATSANLFVVKDGVLKTPPPECFLNGITRQTVINLAKDLGIPVEVAPIMPEELALVQEIFVTGTAAEVTAVGKIDDREYKVGEITKRLQAAYSDLTVSHLTTRKTA